MRRSGEGGRPAGLLARRMPCGPVQPAPGIPTAVAAIEATQPCASVPATPRASGRHRLPWGVAQLSEQADSARGPEWTFPAQP
ncbi:hypothetical protein [uncultured Methylobacterium sp.]|uniref:hypothetical protein n=1 Tax=uncultured Methylobacterium sp. TaxID=157278 RepID=UPI0035CB61EA